MEPIFNSDLLTERQAVLLSRLAGLARRRSERAHTMTKARCAVLRTRIAELERLLAEVVAEADGYREALTRKIEIDHERARERERERQHAEDWAVAAMTRTAADVRLLNTERLKVALLEAELDRTRIERDAFEAMHEARLAQLQETEAQGGGT